MDYLKSGWVTSQSNTFSIGIFLKLKILKRVSSYTGVNTVYKQDHLDFNIFLMSWHKIMHGFLGHLLVLM